MGSEGAGIGVQWESDSAWGWGCSSLLVVRVPGIPGSVQIDYEDVADASFLSLI